MGEIAFGNDTGDGAAAERGSRSATRGASNSPEIGVLNQALALANQTVLRCKWQYGLALRYHSPQFAAAALGHANEARIHADKLEQRIVALGGEPRPLPSAAAGPAHSRPVQHHGKPLAGIIDDQLAAARAAIQGYRKIGAYFDVNDAATAALIGEIVASEETCAAELADVDTEAVARAAP